MAKSGRIRKEPYKNKDKDRNGSPHRNKRKEKISKRWEHIEEKKS